MVLRYLESTKEKSNYYYGSKKFNCLPRWWLRWPWRKKKIYQWYIFLFGKSTISWNFKTQKGITLSTTEAKYVALTECAQHGMKLKRLLKEIFNKEINIKIKVENRSC